MHFKVQRGNKEQLQSAEIPPEIQTLGVWGRIKNHTASIVTKLQNAVGITQKRELARADASWRLLQRELDAGHAALNQATEGLVSIIGHSPRIEGDFRSILQDGELIHRLGPDFYGSLFRAGSYGSVQDEGNGIFVPEPYKPIPFVSREGEDGLRVDLQAIKWIIVRPSKLEQYNSEALQHPDGAMARHIGKMRTYEQFAEEINKGRDEFLRLQSIEIAKIMGTYRG